MELSPFLYSLSSSFWPWVFALSFNVFISLSLRNFSISAPLLFFVTSTYCRMVSFRLLAFLILKLNLPSILLLAFYTFGHLLLPVRTSSVSLLPYSSTLKAYIYYIYIMFPKRKNRSPLPWCSYPYAFIEFWVFDHVYYVTHIFDSEPYSTRPPILAILPLPLGRGGGA